MTTAIQKLEPGFTDEQRQLIRDMFARGANDQEFNALIAVSEAHNLNPVTKQIYFVQRYDSSLKRKVWATQVSIDGLRLKAQRTGDYDGQDEPEYEYADSDQPSIARVKVYRKGIARPFVGVARWSEYVQKTREGKTTRFWNLMGHVMLSKCAEALALRKAFPDETSGLYTAEEMGQAENDAVPAKPPVQEAEYEPAVPNGLPLPIVALVEDFESCNSPDRLAELEETRRELWPLMNSDSKRALKKVSAVARESVDRAQTSEETQNGEA